MLGLMGFHLVSDGCRTGCSREGVNSDELNIAFPEIHQVDSF